MNRAIGHAAAWSLLAMALVQVAVVVARHVFAAPVILGAPALWWQEAVVYLFGVSICLGAGYGLLQGAHVRIDPLYRALSPRVQAGVDVVGAVVLLLPLAALILWASWPTVAIAWAVREGAADAGGLPLRFVLKSGVLALAALLGLQGIAQALRAMVALSSPAP